MTTLKKITGKNSKAASSKSTVVVRADRFNKLIEEVNRLSAIEASANPPYKVWFGKFTQEGAQDNNVLVGALYTGSRYAILSYAAGDDFTNVGASSNANGVHFIATGDTPAVWTNGSKLGYFADIVPEEIHNNTGLSIAVHHDNDVGKYRIFFFDSDNNSIDMTDAVFQIFTDQELIYQNGYCGCYYDNATPGYLELRIYDGSDVASDTAIAGEFVEIRVMSFNNAVKTAIDLTFGNEFGFPK